MRLAYPLILVSLVACADGSTKAPASSSGGSGGSAGQAGASGGAAGSGQAGQGSAAEAGSAGESGAAGEGGQAGSSGSAGSAGASGDGGAAGSGGDPLAGCDGVWASTNMPTASLNTQNGTYQFLASVTTSNVDYVSLYANKSGLPASLALSLGKLNNCDYCSTVTTGGRIYYGESGTVETVGELKKAAKISVTYSGARFAEVEVEQGTGMFKKVTNGQTWCIPSLTFEATIK